MEFENLTSSMYLADADVLLKARVKRSGGNYLVLDIEQLNGFGNVEVVVLKQSVAKLKAPKQPMRLELDRSQDLDPSILEVQSYAHVAVVRPYDELNELTQHQWLQDLEEVYVHEDK